MTEGDGRDSVEDGAHDLMTARAQTRFIAVGTKAMMADLHDMLESIGYDPHRTHALLIKEE